MGSKSKVITYTNAAQSTKDTNQKLDYITQAIAELAVFVDDLENAISRVDRKSVEPDHTLLDG